MPSDTPTSGPTVPATGSRSAPPRRAWLPWSLWVAGTLAAGLYLSQQLLAKGSDRSVFLPGATTDGHYQIEVECDQCHTSAFTSADEMQTACESCHLEELEAVEDSHPKSKFTDPRNADRVAQLDARYCVTCHLEHRPDATGEMGLTLPDDYCFRCHADVAEERPSHEGMAFSTCADAGCHNFHDNRALYEDFIDKHLDEPDERLEARVLALTSAPRDETPDPPPPLALGDQDAPAAYRLDPGELADWAASGHGQAGINCRVCHEREGAFALPVEADRCSNCHEREYRGWQLGKHGARLGAQLPPMSVGEARRPMKLQSSHQLLGCSSCHAAHDFDTRHASVRACLGCHDDQHSRNYEASPHAQLFVDELLGKGEPGSGVSCATCHMPRTQSEAGTVVVQHNQNANLRPPEKMIRSVCNQCHGLGFSLSALASPEAIRLNFSVTPTHQVQSLEMVRSRRDR